MKNQAMQLIRETPILYEGLGENGIYKGKFSALDERDRPFFLNKGSKLAEIPDQK